MKTKEFKEYKFINNLMYKDWGIGNVINIDYDVKEIVVQYEPTQLNHFTKVYSFGEIDNNTNYHLINIGRDINPLEFCDFIEDCVKKNEYDRLDKKFN